jgi:hypothetical protein
MARFFWSMAKSDSFFIRASATMNGATEVQTGIDLGAYVDALGKSVLRIHNIAVRYDFGSTGPAIQVANGECGGFFQLTTQSQATLVPATDRSIISTGQIHAANATANPNQYTFYSDSLDVAPQHWRNGYLVGVEQIYLLVQSNGNGFTTDPRVEIVMECTVETLSQAAAMALSLSQQ